MWFVKHRKERSSWAKDREFFHKTAGDEANRVIATAATRKAMCQKCTVKARNQWQHHGNDVKLTREMVKATLSAPTPVPALDVVPIPPVSAMVPTSDAVSSTPVEQFLARASNVSPEPGLAEEDATEEDAAASSSTSVASSSARPGSSVASSEETGSGKPEQEVALSTAQKRARRQERQQERIAARTCKAASPDPDPSADPASEWDRVESRSKPGEFYYLNSRSGDRSWTLPAAVARASLKFQRATSMREL